MASWPTARGRTSGGSKSAREGGAEVPAGQGARPCTTHTHSRGRCGAAYGRTLARIEPRPTPPPPATLLPDKATTGPAHSPTMAFRAPSGDSAWRATKFVRNAGCVCGGRTEHDQWSVAGPCSLGVRFEEVLTGRKRGNVCVRVCARACVCACVCVSVCVRACVPVWRVHVWPCAGRAPKLRPGYPAI
jgi:hypothetical protein